LEAEKPPSEPVVLTERVPEGTWVTVTVALAMAPPESSVTLPRIVPVTSCANSADVVASAAMAAP
jgi:hypothetical protein